MPHTVYYVLDNTSHPVVYLENGSPVTWTTNINNSLSYATAADAQAEADLLNNGGSKYSIGSRPHP